VDPFAVLVLGAEEDKDEDQNLEISAAGMPERLCHEGDEVSEGVPKKDYLCKCPIGWLLMPQIS
jgi:hypothetical protein